MAIYQATANNNYIPLSGSDAAFTNILPYEEVILNSQADLTRFLNRSIFPSYCRLYVNNTIILNNQTAWSRFYDACKNITICISENSLLRISVNTLVGNSNIIIYSTIQPTSVNVELTNNVVISTMSNATFFNTYINLSGGVINSEASVTYFFSTILAKYITGEYFIAASSGGEVRFGTGMSLTGSQQTFLVENTSGYVYRPYLFNAGYINNIINIATSWNTSIYVNAANIIGMDQYQLNHSLATLATVVNPVVNQVWYTADRTRRIRYSFIADSSTPHSLLIFSPEGSELIEVSNQITQERTTILAQGQTVFAGVVNGGWTINVRG